MTNVTPTLPHRPGAPPTVVGPAPHGQRSQTAPVTLQEELWARMWALPFVYLAPTTVSVPLARALHLPEGIGSPDPMRFQGHREFAHMHPHEDGSLHLMLPATVMAAVEEAGWGVRHPVQRSTLVYGPRDRSELEVIWHLAQVSHSFSMGAGESD